MKLSSLSLSLELSLWKTVGWWRIIRCQNRRGWCTFYTTTCAATCEANRTFAFVVLFDMQIITDGVRLTCVDSRVDSAHLRGGQVSVSALVAPSPRTGCAQPAGEDLVPLSTPMSGLTDNTGLTDCSIIAQWQGKRQEDSVIYVLNCLYSTRQTSTVSPRYTCRLTWASVQQAPNAAPRHSQLRATRAEWADEWWIRAPLRPHWHIVPAARIAMWLHGWPLRGHCLILLSAVPGTEWMFV